jgi:hypothetical protein
MLARRRGLFFMDAIPIQESGARSCLGLTQSAWRRVGQLLLALALVITLQAVATACPTCKDGLAQNDPAGQSLVQGYFWSILFMMSMPFLIFSALGGYFYWEIRKARRTQDTVAGSSLPQRLPTVS